MKKAFVILPTFNGAKYLAEQLDSLYNQTYPDITIYTRDDGSTDKTTSIIQQYAKKKNPGRKIIIIPSHNETWGCPDCFLKLLEYVKGGDYYFYCDQDDVWLPNKISDAVNAMEKDDKTPTVYFSAFRYCDSHLKPMYRSPKMPTSLSLQNVLYDYWPLGFSLSFNKAFYQFFMNHKPKKIYYHDCFIAQVAFGCGRFIYSDKIATKYRRQENAVTYSNHSKISLLKWRIKTSLGKDSKLPIIKRGLKDYLKTYRVFLSNSDIKMLETFVQDNFKNYWKKIFYPHRLRLKMTDEIILRLLFVLRKL